MISETLRTTLRQRCFWLFGALLLQVVMVPFFEDTPQGRLVLIGANLAVLIAGAAAITRSAGSVVITTLLAAPAVGFQALALVYDQPQLRVLSQSFSVAFQFALIVYLLDYVFRRDVLTMDKLYGAAGAFLLMSALWMYLYIILMGFYPGAFTINGAPMTEAPVSTLLYFSLATLTATGMSDVLPVHPVARMTCALEMTAGVLFLAVLIARLAGNYPPQPPRER